jgi:choline dehydrogenase-like flavoprotein
LKLGNQGEVNVSSPDQNGERKSRNNFIKSANTNLFNSLKRYKIFPLKIFCKKLEPGSGVHYGGWLEMGVRSDLLGRPFGTKNIHVVDSSVLPTIPAGPITFSIMANALRITSSFKL